MQLETETFDEATPRERSFATPLAMAKRRARKNDRAAWLFLSPWLIGFFTLTAGPMLASLYL
jgi:multiple sugar transport system permease protein